MDLCYSRVESKDPWKFNEGATEKKMGLRKEEGKGVLIVSNRQTILFLDP